MIDGLLNSVVFVIRVYDYNVEEYDDFNFLLCFFFYIGFVFVVVDRDI